MFLQETVDGGPAGNARATAEAGTCLQPPPRQSAKRFLTAALAQGQREGAVEHVPRRQACPPRSPERPALRRPGAVPPVKAAVAVGDRQECTGPAATVERGSPGPASRRGAQPDRGKDHMAGQLDQTVDRSPGRRPEPTGSRARPCRLQQAAAFRASADRPGPHRPPREIGNGSQSAAAGIWGSAWLTTSRSPPDPPERPRRAMPARARRVPDISDAQRRQVRDDRIAGRSSPSRVARAVGRPAAPPSPPHSRRCRRPPRHRRAPAACRRRRQFVDGEHHVLHGDAETDDGGHGAWGPRNHALCRAMRRMTSYPGVMECNESRTGRRIDNDEMDRRDRRAGGIGQECARVLRPTGTTSC